MKYIIPLTGYAFVYCCLVFLLKVLVKAYLKKSQSAREAIESGDFEVGIELLKEVLDNRRNVFGETDERLIPIYERLLHAIQQKLHQDSHEASYNRKL